MEFEPRHVVMPDHGLPIVADVDVLVVGGGAAGLAAATAVERGTALRSIPGEELRSLLNADGARLD